MQGPNRQCEQQGSFGVPFSTGGSPPGNLMEEAHKVYMYKWGIVAMTTKQFTSWALHCTSF